MKMFKEIYRRLRICVHIMFSKTPARANAIIVTIEEIPDDEPMSTVITM